MNNELAASAVADRSASAEPPRHDATSRRKLLYIAGYGRCGSTVLATVLGNHPEMVHVGEVSYLFEDWMNPTRPCSCREQFADCKFWQGAVPAGISEADTGRVVRSVERASFLPRLWLGGVSDDAMEAYRASQDQVLGHALSRSGAAIVVDSSKSAQLTVGRSVALRKLVGKDVYFLHLVREGLSSLESRVITGSNWALEGHRHQPRLATLRAVLGWIWSNWCASVMMRRSFGKRHYMLLRYEDFLADPATSLRRIGDFVGVDTSDLVTRVEQGKAFEVGHVVGGNRIRFQQAITVRRQEDRPKGEQLTRRQRLLFSILGGWLNRRYGYSA
jgi:hypothetical protein